MCLRKSDAWKIKDTIKLMDEGCATLKQANAANVGVLLNDLDALAEQTVSFLESVGGEQTKTAEMLGSLRGRIAKANGKPVGAVAESLRGLVNQINTAAKKELHGESFEVLFIVARADLWDAYETVWLAATADTDCDVYVMPVPYSHIAAPEKHGDKPAIIGDWQDESGKMPSYVPVTDWRKYDIEQHHPNAIFVEWPYDENANLMFIHEDFYCSRIRKFTDAMYWIPYHVLPVDNDFERWACHWGSLYAKRVFLQSEQIRQKFIKSMHEFERVNHCEGQYGDAEEKAVALGSPKFDRILNSKPKDFELPEKWRKLIYRLDGSKKTIVLYNTHCGGMANGTTYIRKLAEVVGYFANREDVVLWWRPHPLLTAGYSANDMEYKSLYDKVANKYRELGFGIWDDTPDLHRAMCFADIYYGDGSSLVALAQCKGMPVLLQNAVTFAGAMEVVRPSFFKSYNDKVFFTPKGHSVLYCMKKESHQITCEGRMPNTDDYAVYYSAPSLIDDTLYFAVDKARELLAFDIKNERWRSFPVDEEIIQMAKTNWRKFMSPVKYCGNLYYVGCSIPAILKLNQQSGQMDVFSGFKEELDSKIRERSHLNVFSSRCQVGSKIYAVSPESAAVLVFDMEEETYKIYEVGNKARGWVSLVYKEGLIWLLPRSDTPITSWDPASNDVKEYSHLPEGFTPGENAYAFMFRVSDRLMVFPNRGNMVLVIDTSTGAIESVRDFGKRLWDRPKATMFSCIDGTFHVHYADDASITTVNSKTGDTGSYLITTADLPDFTESDDIPPPGVSVEESAMITLDSIIRGYESMDRASYAKAHSEFLSAFISGAEGKAGAEIYQYVKELWIGRLDDREGR